MLLLQTWCLNTFFLLDTLYILLNGNVAISGLNENYCISIFLMKFLKLSFTGNCKVAFRHRYYTHILNIINDYLIKVHAYNFANAFWLIVCPCRKTILDWSFVYVSRRCPSIKWHLLLRAEIKDDCLVGRQSLSGNDRWWRGRTEQRQRTACTPINRSTMSMLTTLWTKLLMLLITVVIVQVGGTVVFTHFALGWICRRNEGLMWRCCALAQQFFLTTYNRP